MPILFFATVYTATPRPSSSRHIHRSFQPVTIEWACEDRPGWYFVRPLQPESAPILYRSGWYVHQSHLHILNVPDQKAASVVIPCLDALKEG